MIPPRWHKIIDDLWGNKGRTILVVLAIAVGVQMFGGVLMGNVVMNSQIREAFLETNPPTIIMGVSPFEQNLVEAVEAAPGVAAATGLTINSVKLITPGRDYNMILTTFGDPENIRVQQITVEEGTWPPGPREIALERTNFAVIGAELGDSIIIELPGGEQRELRIVARIHSLHATPAALFPEFTGYVTPQTLNWLGFEERMSRLLVVSEPDIAGDLRLIDAQATSLRDRIEHDGYRVGSISTQLQSENIVAEQIAGVGAFLSGIGVFSLLLSAFLVVNTISAVLTQQKRQIGMLKAVGATGPQVTGLYLSLVLALGVLGLLVSIPLALGLSYLSASAVLNFGNYNFERFWAPGWVLVLMGIASLLVPALSALVPIWLSGRVSVREALSDFGISQVQKQNWIDRLISSVRTLPRPVLLSLRNTFRRRGRLALTLGTLTLAGAMFMGVLSTRSALMGFLDRVFALYNYDVNLNLNGVYPIAVLEREAYRVPGITLAETWLISTAQVVRQDESLGETFPIFGLSPDGVMLQPTLLQGRWLENEDRDTVVVNLTVATREGVTVGEWITLRIDERDYDFQVVGVIESVGDPEVYTSDRELGALLNLPGQGNILLVQTADRSAEGQTAARAALEDRLESAGMAASFTITRAEIIESNEGSFNFIVGFMLSLAMLLAVVGGLGLASTMSLNVLERTREIGVMRGIGADNSMLLRVVLAEGLVIAVLSWLAAIPVSIGLAWLLATTLGLALIQTPLPLVVATNGFSIWLPMVLVLAIISSLLPALRAARVSVREALAYE